MDFRSSSLVPLLYLILGISIVGVACFAFLIYRPVDGERATQQFSEAIATSDDSRFRTPTQVSTRDTELNEAYAQTVQRMLHLEELLDKRTKLLEQKSALLEKKDAEYGKLKEDVDHYLLLLGELAPMQLPQSEESDSTTSEDSDAQETTALRQQLEQLRARLARNKETERLLESELDDLKTELNDAYAEMAEQQLAAVLVDQEDAVSEASARILVGMGAEAIPEIVALLSDRRVEVRAWAASVLGRFGPLAEGSLPRLREMLSDPDGRVREAAGRSIDIILN